MTATVPAGSGTVDVTVSNPSGQSVTSTADQYTYGPVVTGIYGGPISSLGGQSVTVDGTGFTGTSAVEFNGVPAESFSAAHDWQLTAVSPPGAGILDVTVTNQFCTSAVVPADMYWASPVVTSITPSTGTTAGGTAVTISGAGFTGATAVGFNEGSGLYDWAPSFNVVSDTEIVAITPPYPYRVNIPVMVQTQTGAMYSTVNYSYNPSLLPPKPSFTSASSASATAGTPFRFTVSASGNPTFAALPKDGVTLTENHNGTATLSGTPVNGGVFPITVSAKDTAGSATQTFTLTVDAAPAITSGTAVNATTGTPFSSTIKTKGYPAPSISYTSTPALPSGVTLVDNGNGTATLSGTAPVGSYGAYSLALTATNGIGSPAKKTVTLRLNEAPAVTSGDSVTVQRGVAMTPFPLAASGYPAPTIFASGLPTGLTVKLIGGQRVISGTPANNDALGDYTVTLTAKNAKGVAIQTFTLTLTS
jgi:hypothetical protein